jgi:3-oxoacyl-[acyl-carrier protein] reductase
MLALQGQTALVCGGSGLIGSAIAERLASEGARIIVQYCNNQNVAQRTVKQIRESGGEALPLHADLRGEAAVLGLLQETLESFGAIHIAVDSAYGDFTPKYVAEMDWGDWQIHLEALKSTFLVCKSVVPLMRKQRYGRIVYISGGLARRYFRGCSAYTAMKAGINGLCKTLALEEGEHGITVNIVAPGKVVDPRKAAPGKEEEALDELGGHRALTLPLRRFALPEDVAEAVLYFVSPKASGITGQTLFVAGGEIMP